MATVRAFLENLGVADSLIDYAVFGVRLVCFVPLVYVFFRLSRSYTNKFILLLVRRVRSEIINSFLKARAGEALYFFVLVLLIYTFGVEPLCAEISYLVKPVSRIFLAYIILLIIIFLVRIIQGLYHYALEHPRYKDNPIEGYAIVGKVVVYIVGGIYAVATLLGQDPMKAFGLLGGASVVLIFAFKDLILGFLASIQLAYFDMVHIGDWITLDNYGADGEVVEIHLASVKVQNFDQTFTTIPTYALISGSFKNWQGMLDSGGRRIKRSILIDKNSIQFCTPEMIQEFEKIDLIRDYVRTTQDQLEATRRNQANPDLKINGVHMTNLGCYRVYIECYLASLPHINTEMECLVRHLDANEKGLPIEVYAFSKIKKFKGYEQVVADIFDHLYASTSYFNLNIVQVLTSQQDTTIKA